MLTSAQHALVLIMGPVESAPLRKVNTEMPAKPEIEEALERVCSSRPFATSPRMIRFIRFVVEKQINGQADDIREVQIGREVFDRWPAYDPKIDTIVRVEARRLRRKLEEYYRADGRKDPIRVAIPGPGYLPKIGYASDAD